MKCISIYFLVFLVGCATPAERFKHTALSYGFKFQVQGSKGFKHQLFLADNMAEDGILHIYLDGDGTPWERQRWVADDPTARNPLILRLMQQDQQSAILLGRPCYYGIQDGCDSKYWTSQRYSKPVVDSMVQALNAWLKQYDFKQIVLIGYSGGGTIAMLMANRIKKLSTVVTVAANLDVDEWSKFHGYSILGASLNPANESELHSDIRQIHIAGKDDDVVPIFIIREFAEKQGNAQFYVFHDHDHACCWEESWGKILMLIRE